jgi:hypothetical protein
MKMDKPTKRILLFALLPLVLPLSIFLMPQYTLAISSSLFIAPSFFNQAFAQSYNTYENNDNNYAINYPSTWLVDEGNPATFTSPDHSSVSVTVTAIDNPISSTLQGFTNWDINYLKNEADSFRLIHSHPSTLAGLPAYTLVYSGNGILTAGPETDLEIYTIDGQGTLYSIVYSAIPSLYNSYLPLAEGMINSFDLTGNTSPSGPNSGSGSSSSSCPTPGPGGCNGAFSQGPGPYSALNPNYGQIPLQQNIPTFNPNS